MNTNPFKETPGTIASKILMLRAAKRKAIMLLEGTHDARVMSNFVDERHCLLVVAWGKENALAALPLVREREPNGIICVLDRDFDFIRGVAVEDANVIYADCHDLDLMMFKSPALEKVLRELASPEKMRRFSDLRSFLLKAAEPIACLRLHSIEANDNLTFDDMSFDFVKSENLSFEVRNMVHEVLNRSRRPPTHCDALVEKIAHVQQRSLDSWELCVAEDVLKMLTKALYRMIGSQKPSKIGWRNVQTYLRLGYERDFFRASILYTRIKEWEKIQSPFICLTV